MHFPSRTTKCTTLFWFKKGCQELSDKGKSRRQADRRSAKHDSRSDCQKQLRASKLVTESQLTSLTTELKEGKLSGVVCEKAIADNYLATYPDKYAVAKVKLVTPEENKNIDIGIRKDDKDLKKRVDKVLTKLEKSGQLDEMFKKAQKIQAENK